MDDFYRDLLKRYMANVLEVEGVHYVEEMCEDEDYNALCEIAEELGAPIDGWAHSESLKKGKNGR